MIGKEHIIAFAAEKFTQFGSKRFTMDELAALLGISKKTIYQYFSSKEDLVVASIQYLINEYNETLEHLIKSEKDPITSIILMYEKAFERLKYFKPSFIFGLRKYYPLANKVFDDFRNNFVKERIYSLLKVAKEKDILLEGVNLDLFCDLYFKRFEEVAFIRNNLFDVYSNTDLLNHFIVFSLRGITKPNYSNPYFE
ncbi:TetR/AcrR family transcriptional regulator [Tamlana crocina]|uniref:TetR/AcrR family transcriptional regulator n=1 Tax=Tamlana crocina TaxID=393006 RepID=A0ABX1DF75_9FLAO|nr:TetR/AcrR family transcriptional regulator [Tamlana crocina]NJX16102.1 TetR/AcrR family transcriptional regulator [Tamlana crocina]